MARTLEAIERNENSINDMNDNIVHSPEGVVSEIIIIAERVKYVYRTIFFLISSGLTG